MPDTLFGQWMHTTSGVHYVLGGKPLCGCRAKPGEKIMRGEGEVFPVSHYFDLCPVCRAANVARWAGK